jgi:hypothetical protein
MSSVHQLGRHRAAAARGVAAQPKNIFSYIVAIGFPDRVDVLDRLYKHFELVELMTSASVTQHFGKYGHSSSLLPTPPAGEFFL